MNDDVKARRAAYARQWRKLHPGYDTRDRSDYSREYNQTESAKEAQKRYRQSEKGRRAVKRWLASPNVREKYRAREKIANEIRRGRIVRPKTCEACGRRGQTEAHHRDYSRPLEVRWLCVRCHRKEHEL